MKAITKPAPKPAVKRKKGGRKELVLNSQQLAMVEKLAGQGLTPHQICDFMSFSYTSFYKMKKNQEIFDQHYNRGKARGLAIIANALFDNAKDGDVSAQIFYLKARDQQSWNPKVNLDVETTEVHELKLTIVDDFGD